MPADMGGKSPLRDGSNEKSILAKIKQILPLLQFKTCAPALSTRAIQFWAGLAETLVERVRHAVFIVKRV
jgi:hypothetical protein